jgi:ABC-2 type transport system permease protein
MNRIRNILQAYYSEFLSVVRNEYRAIFTDGGVALVLVMAIFIYTIIYSFAYGPEVLRNIPIGVVDESQTPLSRDLVQAFDAGPNAYVAYEPTSMEEAKQLFYDRKIYGVVYIPQDYAKQVMGGLSAPVSLYVDASYFLMYRQVFQELVSGIGQTGAMVRLQRLIAKGVNLPQAQAVTQPVIYQSTNLFNPYLGYGSFMMPAIIIVIIQQTLLVGIGMIGGTWREQGLYRKLIPTHSLHMYTLPIVLGKAVVYSSIYAVSMFYIFTIHYRLFHYPSNGATWDVVGFLIPYLLSCIMLGIALSTLFRYREQSLLFLLWTSIPILLLSGASFPSEAIPSWLYNFGKIFPSSSGVNGYIRIRTMGATLRDVLPELRTLWMLVFIYGGLACLGIRRVTRRND